MIYDTHLHLYPAAAALSLSLFPESVSYASTGVNPLFNPISLLAPSLLLQMKAPCFVLAHLAHSLPFCHCFVINHCSQILLPQQLFLLLVLRSTLLCTDMTRLHFLILLLAMINDTEDRSPFFFGRVEVYRIDTPSSPSPLVADPLVPARFSMAAAHHPCVRLDWSPRQSSACRSWTSFVYSFIHLFSSTIDDRSTLNSLNSMHSMNVESVEC